MDNKLVNYSKSRNLLQEFFDLAFKVSSLNQEIKTYTDRTFFAAESLTDSVLLLQSLIQILPNTTHETNSDSFIDYKTVCTLTRNIIDNYIFFFYNCNDDVSKEEISFRIKLSIYHGQRESHRIQRKISSVGEWQQYHVEKTKREIRNHPFFKKFDERKQKSILKGKNAYYLSRREIISRIGLDVSEFKALYKYLSNQVHSYTYSSYLASFDFLYSLIWRLNHDKLNEVLNTTIKFMALTLKDYRKRFTRFSDHYSETDIQLINKGVKRLYLFESKS